MMRRLLIGLLVFALTCLPASSQMTMTGIGSGGTGGSGPTFSITYQSSGLLNTGSTTIYDFGTLTYGSGCSRVLVALNWYSSATVSDVKIDGVSLAPVANAYATNGIGTVGIDAWESTAALSGSSGQVVVTFSGASSNPTSVALYCLVTTSATRSPTPQNGANAFAATVAATITVPAGGGGIAIVNNNDSGAAAITSLSNTTNLQTVTNGSDRLYFANISGTGSTTVTATFPGAQFLLVVLVTWGP